MKTIDENLDQLIDTETQPPAQTETLGENNPEEASSIKKALDDALKLIEEYKDQTVRMQADVVNQRQRIERDALNAKKYALDGFAKALLPVIDSLERSVKLDEALTDDCMKSMHEGMALTLSMMLKVLEKFGISQLNPEHKTFNPEHHEAVFMREDADQPANTVLEVVEKGYLLHDRLIRPAMVIVSS